MKNDIIFEPIKVGYVNHMGDDLSVVNAARVSFAKQHIVFKQPEDEKLIKYLADNSHWSPFTHNSISVRCRAPIYLARQLVKHQVGGSWNEVSRRYIDAPPTFFNQSMREKPQEGIKQGSGEVLEGVGVSTYMEAIKTSLKAYNSLLEANVAPECARSVLPLSTMTEWIWTGSLYFFARVVNQRADNHAQKEAQEFAKQLRAVINYLFPVSSKYLLK